MWVSFSFSFPSFIPLTARVRSRKRYENKGSHLDLNIPFPRFTRASTQIRYVVIPMDWILAFLWSLHRQSMKPITPQGEVHLSWRFMDISLQGSKDHYHISQTNDGGESQSRTHSILDRAVLPWPREASVDSRASWLAGRYRIRGCRFHREQWATPSFLRLLLIIWCIQLSEGNFRRLFNILKEKDDPVHQMLGWGVPDNFTKLECHVNLLLPIEDSLKAGIHKSVSVQQFSGDATAQGE